MTIKWKGLDNIQKNLNKEISQIKGRTTRGLIKAGAHIRRSMEKTSPKIPVDTGNLRSSWFNTPIHLALNPATAIGFSANYAWFVHENVGSNFLRKGAGAKFFEAALEREKGNVLKIIAKDAKIK